MVQQTIVSPIRLSELPADVSGSAYRKKGKRMKGKKWAQRTGTAVSVLGATGYAIRRGNRSLKTRMARRGGRATVLKATRRIPLAGRVVARKLAKRFPILRASRSSKRAVKLTAQVTGRLMRSL